MHGGGTALLESTSRTIVNRRRCLTNRNKNERRTIEKKFRTSGHESLRRLYSAKRARQIKRKLLKVLQIVITQIKKNIKKRAGENDFSKRNIFSNVKTSRELRRPLGGATLRKRSQYYFFNTNMLEKQGETKDVMSSKPSKNKNVLKKMSQDFSE